MDFNVPLTYSPVYLKPKYAISKNCMISIKFICCSVGVQLPAHFRVFIKFFANGGCGPGECLLPLNLWDRYNSHDIHHCLDHSHLQMKCPLFPDQILCKVDDLEMFMFELVFTTRFATPARRTTKTSKTNR